MLKKFKQQMKNEKGLTLIELLAVIVILAIVAAIAIPAIGNIINNSRIDAVKADAQNALAAANLYFVENDTAATVKVSDLVSSGNLDNKGTLDDTSEITKGTTNSPSNKFDGSGETKSGTKVTFTAATSEMIANSKKGETTVPGTTTP